MSESMVLTRLERYRRHLLFSTLLNKLASTKAAGMAIALILTLCGALMIFQNIRDEGFIDIKTPFITGHAKSGFVGVLLITAGLIITVSTILSGAMVSRTMAKSRAGTAGKNQKIKVRAGNQVLEWEGRLDYWEEAERVEELLKSVQRALRAETEMTGQSEKPPKGQDDSEILS